MQKHSYLKSENAIYIDHLFEVYRHHPEAVDESWRYFFDGIELGQDFPPPSEAPSNQASSALQASQKTSPAPSSSVPASEARVAELILAYRQRGRLLADINPLQAPLTSHPSLDFTHFGFSKSDLDQTFAAGHLVGLGTARLKDIIALLKETYCGSVAVEFSHIQIDEEREWLQKQMETSRNQAKLDSDTKKLILKRLSESETFEKFLHTRYVAQKRFSIEGAEALIPALDCMMEAGAELGAEEFVVGMAHRGRLNVLVNTFGKKPEQIFTEFEGQYKPDISKGEGDVKYHMGYSADMTTRKGKKLHISLAANPSHLEFVNSVVQGIARAKQYLKKDQKRSQIISVAIHGDASFAGQGVCYETLNLSLLEGYSTGGTIHVVINNQVGFTSAPDESRSTPYCTDLAKMLETPIFHVNGDHPEALWYVAQLSMEYRQRFKKDVFIDLVCYRKHGHNEGDEPAFTQPLMYKTIKAHKTPRELYAAELSRLQLVSEGEAEGIVSNIIEKLSEAQATTKKEAPVPTLSSFEGRWSRQRLELGSQILGSVETQVDAEKLKRIAERLYHFPEGFKCHPKLIRLFETRSKTVADGKGLDWGTAEALAYGSLLTEGHAVRLSGQDAQRGTFSHRHAVLHDFESGELYTPLNYIQDDQEKIRGP